MTYEQARRLRQVIRWQNETIIEAARLSDDEPLPPVLVLKVLMVEAAFREIDLLPSE